MQIKKYNDDSSLISMNQYVLSEIYKGERERCEGDESLGERDVQGGRPESLESLGEGPVEEEEESLEMSPFDLLFPSAKKMDTCRKVSG